MRLPPLRTIFLEGQESFRRFSAVIITAALGTAAAVTLMGRASPIDQPLYQTMTGLLLTALLGVPLLTAITVASERARLTPLRQALVTLGGVTLLVLYYISLPSRLTDAPTEYLIRWGALLTAFHLLVSFAPFTGRGDISQFWEFNKVLFLRLLTALLFTFVLWTGLSIALVAVEKLFGVRVPGERYPQLFAFLLGIFNTWFFLAGIPRDVAGLDAGQAYPKGLKIFAQFVLIPLVAIYLVILYAYTVKILLDWDWPKGWVGYLVLGFSLSGMFAVLLVHPIVTRAGNAFIRGFSRYYYAALLPMSVLLFLAIYRRIAEYGITEARYYVLVLSFWLAGMVLYFLISKRKSIKMIPISLCAVALLSAFGPWGAQGVTVTSQKGRLEELLQKKGMLSGGRVQKPGSAVTFEDAKQISSIIRHFATVNGIGPLEPLFGSPMDSLLTDQDQEGKLLPTYRQAQRLASVMGVHYVEEWENASSPYRSLETAGSGTVPIQGFDRMIRMNVPMHMDGPPIIAIGDERWRVDFDRASQTFTVARPGVPGDSVRFFLTPFVRKTLRDESLMAQPEHIPPERLMLDAFGRSMKLRLAFDHIGLETRGDSAIFTSGTAMLLIGPLEQAAKPDGNSSLPK